ncbi:MAG: 7-carboxy-7-deazaguanine synthase QueE [Nitrosomonadales bacterium]|nr:7-carboxy-7-deazaguanine synthase QueE [Nitrosomonadales bacterium]MBT4182795.1 7-carboxy-7-deazaguanine synthase QueE [Nitrosomonadales bacterium]MBT5150098.1 7-carboxy-7-deazaguanine synthase QueE [Nitrosomonadales bacterium]MBT6014989.1 7-carboxy-7-deazaguanine synthase QueE [Nitrosomonadales bacterium]MBT6251230.1 7-carboxy-7-deazaguanine synthase QueE [Nitrosomonadales bacterium]
MTSLKINEIFFSLQGESSLIGVPTIFIRLTGCPMRCTYCDTAYSFHDGRNMSINEILKEISKYKTKYVTVTGGEPLAQKLCWELLSKLSDNGYNVSLETGGAISIKGIDERTKIILDVKTPDSGEHLKNDKRNLMLINKKDEIKFVILSREDYVWAKKFIEKENLIDKAPIIFSPVYKKLSYENLSQWILEDSLAVRFQVQLHKIIWGEKAGV